MATNGWYPDPAGTPGRYRYWDGSHWSAETTADPRTPAPTAPDDKRSPSARAGLLVLALVLVVVLIVVGGVLLFRQRGTSVGGPDEPTSTVSSWDDSSPIPTATPSSPSPTPSASPSPTPRPSQTASPTATTSAAPPPQSVACPTEDPTAAAHPADGRVHGGRLSFAQVDSYPAPETDPQFSWMADVTSQTQVTEPGWISIFAVGQVETADDGFGTPEQAAESSIECAITEGWYAEFTGRTNLRDSAITIDGHRGWIVSADIHVDNPDIRVGGDQLTFVVVDDGRPDALSVWCGMVPIGDTARLALDKTVFASLRVD